MEEDEYEKLVFQADFENDGERLYQFYISEYKAVLDGDRFALDCLRNERLSPKIRGFFAGGFRGRGWPKRPVKKRSNEKKLGTSF